VIFRSAGLEGAYILEPEPIVDERGFFARAWCRQELEAQGLSTSIDQCNIAFNEHEGTLRGLHFQRPPHGEVKVVRCTAGALYDVIVDLRPSSPTYLQWVAFELTAENRLALYVPVGFAHGYQTLAEGTEAFYLHSTQYAPESADGVRWDDEAFGIEWPRAERRILNDKDRSWPDYDPERPAF
jgi:dTDP-4-dehydrorhamnose 3,5-epimerase